MSPDTVVTVTFAPFLFAIFTAYWAQTTQRSALLWFLFGLILPPVAGMVLLWLNAKRHAQPPDSIQPVAPICWRRVRT
ncbi:hypothetical protein LJR125_000487 [Pseudoxanthomonas sp. LjRoot125]|uniref:hypothetical protein n=1 Tax=Pseudoxanthomonas sp. LjRoot125 TaxID=3342258 RepID=UPI003E115D3A